MRTTLAFLLWLAPLPAGASDRAPGTFGYHCRLHGQPGRGMAGIVRVVPR